MSFKVCEYSVRSHVDLTGESREGGMHSLPVGVSAAARTNRSGRGVTEASPAVLVVDPLPDLPREPLYQQ